MLKFFPVPVPVTIYTYIVISSVTDFNFEFSECSYLLV